MGNETSSLSKSKEIKSAKTNTEVSQPAQIVVVKEKPLNFSKTVIFFYIVFFIASLKYGRIDTVLRRY